jgi:hypothetical protein
VCVTERVDVENIDVRRSEKDVLKELRPVSKASRTPDMFLELTQVNMCQGSKKRSDAMNHMTYVVARDTMIEKNSLLVNKSENWNDF